MKLGGLCFQCLNSCSCLLMLLKNHRKAVPVFGRSVMATRAFFQRLLCLWAQADTETDVWQSSEPGHANMSGSVL